MDDISTKVAFKSYGMSFISVYMPKIHIMEFNAKPLGLSGKPLKVEFYF
jgi:hypothetical protein